jgi:hypothetical protein
MPVLLGTVSGQRRERSFGVALQDELIQSIPGLNQRFSGSLSGD